MLALTLVPGVRDTLELGHIDEPEPRPGDLVAEVLALGICGTDREIAQGDYGSAPAGSERLVLGHEALCRVTQAPPRSGWKVGDRFVPMVRHPDGRPCAACAVDEWDMCRNGGFTEHGIKDRHGFGAERIALDPNRCIRVPNGMGLNAVLLEPASILAKAWEQIARIGRRSTWQPRRAVVTGAGPIGLLAALFARQMGLETWVVNRSPSKEKAELTRAIGAEYVLARERSLADVAKNCDVVVECTGSGALVVEALSSAPPGAIVCLTGVSTAGRSIPVDVGALNRDLVLDNLVVFGSVNANRRHYEQALQTLLAADANWLERLITERLAVRDFARAFDSSTGIKSILTFGDAATLDA